MGIVESNTGIGENQTVSFPVIICYSSAPAQNSLMALRRFFPAIVLLPTKIRKLGKKTQLPRFSQDLQNDSEGYGIASTGS